jgi:hypothetical protein
MSELEPTSDLQHLKDTLYGLQSYREISGVEAEPALIQDELREDCTVLVDKKTDDRIVLTPLPANEADFDGAAIWMSNPLGVEIRQGQWDASPKDVIFWVSKALSTRYYNPHTGIFLPFPSGNLAERIEYPTIIPEAMSEYDPRRIPEDYEFLRVPTSDTYTLASGIFDYELENNRRLIAARYGIDDTDAANLRAYDIKVTELLPGDDMTGSEPYAAKRRGEFDREFLLLLDFGEATSLMVMPWGEHEQRVTATDFKIRIYREGMIFDVATRDGKVSHCMPTPETHRYVDRLLHNVAIAND